MYAPISDRNAPGYAGCRTWLARSTTPEKNEHTRVPPAATKLSNDATNRSLTRYALGTTMTE